MPIPSDARSAAALDDERSIPDQLSIGLIKIGLAIRHHAWAGGESANLSPTQGQMLAFLLQHEGDITRPGDLARDLSITGATASVALRSLHDKGLVERHRDPSDARSVLLTLTPKGRDLASQSLTWTDFLSTAASELDADEQAVFQRSIVKMIRTLQERGHIPVAQMCVSCTFFRPYAHAGTENPHHCAFVDEPFGDRQLRIDCRDHDPLPAGRADAIWEAFVRKSPDPAADIPGEVTAN